MSARIERLPEDGAVYHCGWDRGRDTECMGLAHHAIDEWSRVELNLILHRRPAPFRVHVAHRALCPTHLWLAAEQLWMNEPDED